MIQNLPNYTVTWVLSQFVGLTAIQIQSINSFLVAHPYVDLGVSWGIYVFLLYTCSSLDAMCKDTYFSKRIVLHYDNNLNHKEIIFRFKRREQYFLEILNEHVENSLLDGSTVMPMCPSFINKSIIYSA